jgi:peptidyl-prolyl cis-trans isomerase SurA
VVLPLPPQPSEAAKRAALTEIQGFRSVKSCPELLKLGKEKAPQLSSEGKVNPAALPAALRELVTKLPIGQASQPILQRNGVGLIMVCSKDAPAETAKKTGEPSREEVFDSLLKQKLDTVSRRYLRDLRRAAYVDVRV